MSFRALIVGLVGTLMVGCSVQNDPVAASGGDDFPNSMTAASLGKRVAGSLNQYRNWDTSIAVDPSLPSGVQTPSTPTAPAGLAKSLANRATVDSIGIDFSDTADGFVRLFWTSVSVATTTRDTTVIVWNAQARDSISGNETYIRKSGMIAYHLQDRTDRYRYEDADGDGVFNNPGAPADRVRLTYVTTAGTTITTSVLVIDAGPDDNFGTDADNKILYVTYSVTNNGDTLDRYTATDADNDSAIIDSRRDSNVVAIFYGASHVAFKPLIVRREAESRMVIFADSTKNYPIFYRVTDRYASGRTVTYSITGTSINRSFFPGDTAYGLTVWDGAATDSVSADSLRITVLLGPNPHDSLDDSLLAVYAHTERRMGSERDAVLSFASLAPIGNGQQPAAGTVLFSLTGDTGEWTGVEGDFDAQSIVAVITDSRSHRFEVEWDREGNVTRLVERK